MERRVFGMWLVLVVSVLVWTVPALASAPATQATDPTANSPAGVVYSIPLDSARQDAAPHRNGGHRGAIGGPGGGGSSGPPASGSSGSSSPSPAAPAASSSGGSTVRASAAGQPRTAPVLVPGGQPGSLIHSVNGFGSSSSVPGLLGPAPPGLGAVQANAGSAPPLTILLAVLVMAIGAAAGVRASRQPRATPGSTPS